MNDEHNIFINKSVETNDIDDRLPPQTIRRIIRDDRLADSTVTILLLGAYTQYRKHIDWELKSSMIDGSINKKSGILVITLPYINCSSWFCSHPGEGNYIYPNYNDWVDIKTKQEFETRYPTMPERITNNLLNDNANISVIPWERISNNPDNLSFLIAATAKSRLTNVYDTSLPMRMRDYNP